MTGINAVTGRRIEGLEAVRQYARDILLTPLGSRVLLREYGSRVYDLLDRPASAALLAEIQSEAAAALERWLPEVRLRRVRARLSDPAREGGIEIEIDGEWRGGRSGALAEGPAPAAPRAPGSASALSPDAGGAGFSLGFSLGFRS